MTASHPLSIDTWTDKLRFLTARNCVGSCFLAALKNGAFVLHRKPKTNHPADNYLEQVLCWFPDKFVIWSLNLQTGGADHGTYFTEREFGSLEMAYIKALEFYDSKGIPSQLNLIACQRIDFPRDEKGPDA